jgi:hypothetical protein
MERDGEMERDGGEREGERERELNHTKSGSCSFLVLSYY